MTDRAPNVEAGVLEDLLCVERCSTLFGHGGPRPEFWETYLLLRSNRDFFRAEVERVAALRQHGRDGGLDASLLARLSAIRLEFYPLAKRLREFLAKSSALVEGIRLELALVFIMSSPQGRDTATRWMSDRSGNAEEAAIRLKVMGRLADAYCRAILESRKVAWASAVAATPRSASAESASPVAPPPPNPEPVAVPAAVAPPPPKPLPSPITPPPVKTAPADVDSTVKVHPLFLEDLRRVLSARRLLDGMKPAVELWELVTLILALRDETRASIAELERLRKLGKPGEFAGEAYNFRQKTTRMKERYGAVVEELRRYLQELFGSWSGETEELVLALMMATAQSRHRIRQWLERRDEWREEAMHWSRRLLERARGYQESLRQEAAGETAANKTNRLFC